MRRAKQLQLLISPVICVRSVRWPGTLRAASGYRSQHLRLGPRHLVVARYRSAYRRLALLASPRPGMIYYRRSHRVLIIIAQIRGGHDGGAGSRSFGLSRHYLVYVLLLPQLLRAWRTAPANDISTTRLVAALMSIAIRIAYRNLINALTPDLVNIICLSSAPTVSSSSFAARARRPSALLDAAATRGLVYGPKPNDFGKRIKIGDT